MASTVKQELALELRALVGHLGQVLDNLDKIYDAYALKYTPGNWFKEKLAFVHFTMIIIGMELQNVPVPNLTQGQLEHMVHSLEATIALSLHEMLRFCTIYEL